MNPYRDFMTKQAGLYSMLDGAAGNLVNNYQRAVRGYNSLMMAHPKLTNIGYAAQGIMENPIGKQVVPMAGRLAAGALAAGVPMAIGAIGGAIAGHREKHQLEAVFNEIYPQLKKAGIEDANMARRVFMTIAQASPQVATNPLLALNAMLNWYGTSAQGATGFDVNSYAKLQDIQKAHVSNSSFRPFGRR